MFESQQVLYFINYMQQAFLNKFKYRGPSVRLFDTWKNLYFKRYQQYGADRIICTGQQTPTIEN